MDQENTLVAPTVHKVIESVCYQLICTWHIFRIVKQVSNTQCIVYKYLSKHSLKTKDIQFSTRVKHHVQQ